MNSIKVFITLIGTCSHGAVVHGNFWNAVQRTSGKLQNHKGTWEALTRKTEVYFLILPVPRPLAVGPPPRSPKKGLGTK